MAKRPSLTVGLLTLYPQTEVYATSLCSLYVTSFGGIDAQTIALIDEWRHLNGYAIFQGCRFVDVGNRGALHCRLGLSNREFH